MQMSHVEKSPCGEGLRDRGKVVGQE